VWAGGWSREIKVTDESGLHPPLSATDGVHPSLEAGFHFEDAVHQALIVLDYSLADDIPVIPVWHLQEVVNE